jgi:hypothetical protein
MGLQQDEKIRRDAAEVQALQGADDGADDFCHGLMLELKRRL